MSMTKRVWIDRDPAYEDVRKRHADEAWLHAKQFTFRIPTRRKNPLGNRPRWDPIWPSALSQAAQGLGLDHVCINDGFFLRTEEEAANVRAKAKEIEAAMLASLRPKGPKAG